MEAGASATKLLEAGIEALTHANAGELEALIEAARWVGAGKTRAEHQIAIEKLRALGRVIELTHRNLRLLRGTAEWGLSARRTGGSRTEDLREESLQMRCGL